MNTHYRTSTAIARCKFALLLAAAAAWGLSGCGGSGSSTPDPVVTPPVVTTPVTPPVVTPPVIPPVTPPVVPATGIRLLSGELGGAGDIDGMGTQARFDAPTGLASDAAGNVYVADTRNATIRKISSTGAVTTLAGSPGLTGQVDGTGAEARFTQPMGIVSDAGGTLWVADGKLVRKVSPAGVVTTLVDTGSNIQGLARDASGRLYATQGKTVTKITTTPEGGSSFVGIGVFLPGYKEFWSAIAVDALGNMYVTSMSTHSVVKITPAGVVSTFAGHTNSVGASTTIGAAVEQMSAPSGVAIDAQGNVVVTDASDYVRTINPAGILVSVLHMSPKGGAHSWLEGVTVDSNGRVMVVSRYAVYTSGANQMLTEYAGRNVVDGWQREFDTVGANAAGGIYFTDGNYSKYELRSASDDGVVTTIRTLLGTEHAGLWNAISPNGDVYAGGNVVESAWNRFNEKGGFVTKVAKDGTQSVVWTSESQVPMGLQFDANGNLFLQYRPNKLSSFRKPTEHTIARIDGNNAVLSPITLPYQGIALLDQVPPHPNWWLGLPFAVDPSGGYFVADSQAVFKVSATGQMTLLAGKVDAPGAADGTGSAARFNGIASLAVDGAGNVLVADKLNHAIRKITPSGVVTTVVGQLGKVGASVGALPGSLWRPVKVVVDAKGVLYIGCERALLRVQFP